MSDVIIDKVSVRIGSQMYGRFEDFPNTVPHVLAEFVDNALQSFRDHREELLALDPNYKLLVIIRILWDETETKMSQRKATHFIIEDNAGGIAANRFVNAFEPANAPDDNTGLNEFGMGLKTAACWLGNKWTVHTKALGEGISRIVRFDQNVVTKNNLEEVDVKSDTAQPNEHFTKIEITAPTKNVPTEKSLQKIKNELASIYRNSLRNQEMDLYVNNEPIEFTEYAILNAPYYKNPEGAAQIWKKDINFTFGPYKAKGFIGILKELKSSQNGLVLSRRGRVIIGAEEDGRYFPKSIFGSSSGTFRYKRIFGELELEGFAVSFNKNDIQDKENLEMLMEALRDELRDKDFDILAQADNYRADNTARLVQKIVSRHDEAPKTKRTPVTIDTKPIEEKAKVAETQPVVPEPVPEENIINEFKQPDFYDINGKLHRMIVKFIDESSDLCWLGVSMEDPEAIVCNINVKHDFFKEFGEPTDPVIALLKTLAVAKYTTDAVNNKTAIAMMDFFNEYIKKTKV